MTGPSKNAQSASRNRYTRISVLIMAAAAVFLIGVFHSLYNTAKQNLLSIWQNNAIQMARATEYYLARPADAVEFTAIQVEGMMAQGRSNQEIDAFLVTEMESYAALVDNNHTGVYGYCRGEYLDASGWVPEADYVPTERPWYTAAMQAGGKLAFVTPYLNLQTNEMMMSVSKRLSDGESVVSMDIFMNGMQKMAEDMLVADSVKAALVMDKNGNVVVHSAAGEAGKNYLTEGTRFEKEIARLALSVSDGSVSVRELFGDEILYSGQINGDWYALLVLDRAKLLRSIQYVNVILTLILTLTITCWYGITNSFHRKYREAEKLSHEVKAVADIYEAMVLISLKTNRMTLLRSNDELEAILEGNLSGFSQRIPQLAAKIASEPFRDILMPFMDPATYEERMKNVHSVSLDYLNAGGRWARMQLIMVDRDEQGKLWHIIWAIESIDEERRQQEHLRNLAETDALSRLLNRRSGERRVREKLACGSKGMFILLDVDDFKSINDGCGHNVGDQVIIAIADSLRGAFRESDIAFRLGGDEFAVFVPDLEDADQERLILNRLEAELDRIDIPKLKERTVTVSIGTARYPCNSDDSFEAMYQRADQKMYENKRRRKASMRSQGHSSAQLSDAQ